MKPKAKLWKETEQRRTLEHKKYRFAGGAGGKAKFLLASAVKNHYVFLAALLLAASTAVHLAGIELFQPTFAEQSPVAALPYTSDMKQAPSGNSHYRSVSESLSLVSSHGSGSGTNSPTSYYRSISESMSMTTMQGKAPNSYSRSMLEQTSFTTGLPPAASSPLTIQPQRTTLMPYGASSNQRTDERLTPILNVLGKRADTTARNVSGGTSYLMTESISSMNFGSPDRHSEILEAFAEYENPDDSSAFLRQLAAFNEYTSIQKSIQNATLANTAVSSVFLLGAVTVVVARHSAVSGGRMRRKMLALLLIKHVAKDGTVLKKNEIAPLNRGLVIVLTVFAFCSIASAIDPSSGQAFAANLAVNKVQSGTLTLGTNPTDVLITSVDMSKAFAVCFSRTDSSNADRAVTCNLTSSTNLRVQAGIASATITVAWYVVEFKEGAFVQRGETAWTTDTASQNIAISTVDLSKTFVLINTRTTSTSQIMDEQRVTRSALTNSTNLQLTRSGPGFPQVSSITPSTFATDSTTHNVAMPATVASGDLLLVLFTSDGSATVTTPSGWTFIDTATRSTFARGSIYAKIATGSEGGTTVNFATSASEQAAAQVYRIPAGSWYGDITQGIASAVVDPGGTTSSPNPPSLSPSWGSAQNLWIAYWGSSSSASVNSYPTNYASGLHTLAGSGTTGAAVSSASREVEASSENPGAFSLPAAVSGVVYTIAIRPKPFDMAITHVWQVIELQDTVVQSGTTTLSGVSSTTTSITPVDLAETFLVFSTEGATATDGVEAQYYIRGSFTSTTQITFDRNSATNSATVSWFAVSIDRSTVQSGTNAAATTETFFDNTITAITLSRASPFVSAEVGSTGTADQDSGSWVPTFTSTTNLRVQRTSSQSVPSSITWFAMEWPSAARSMSDNLAVSDVISKASSYLLTEQLGASDAVTRSATLSRSLSEQLAVTDVVARSIVLARSPSEQITLSELITKTVLKSMSENLDLTDPIERRIVTSMSMSEQLVVSGDISTARSTTLSESVNITDIIAALVNFTRTVSDDLTVGDTVSSSSSIIIVMTDSMAINEDFANIAVLFHLDLGESLMLVQSFATNFTGFFDQVDSEGIVIGDNVTLMLDSIAIQSELLGLEDEMTVLHTKDVRRSDSRSEFVRFLSESLLVTSAMNTGAPFGSEGKIIIKDIIDSLTLRAEQLQPLHQRVITIDDVTVAVNVADVSSGDTFGTAIAMVNFEITNKGDTPEELVLRLWYSDIATGKILNEIEETITVNAGESIVKAIEIPFGSIGLHNVMVAVKSEDGILSTTDIAVNVPWLAVYLHSLVALASVVVAASIAYVIYAMRRSRMFISGGK